MFENHRDLRHLRGCAESQVGSQICALRTARNQALRILGCRERGRPHWSWATSNFFLSARLVPPTKTSRSSPPKKNSILGLFVCFHPLTSPRVRKLCSASHCTCNRKAKTPSQELKSDAATCCRAPLSVKGSACTHGNRWITSFDPLRTMINNDQHWSTIT